MTFPADLLQTPAFSATADSAVDFGAIGAMLGHEMAHGFDDQGSRFDDKGNLRDRWSAASRAAFDAKAEVFVAQYSGFVPLPGAHLNGRRSLGENPSDLVGVTIALDAYSLHATANGVDIKAKRDGFSGEQRFFLAWAQLWRTQTTETAPCAEIDSAYHWPTKYRVNSVVRNLQTRYDAFGVGDGGKLYVEAGERAKVW